MKAPFRETLWFKRGEFAEPPAGDESPVPLPIEDRYSDDGSVFATDSLRFGLHSGRTCELPLSLDLATEVVSVDPSLDALACELKHWGRKRTFAAVGVSMFVVAVALISFL